VAKPFQLRTNLNKKKAAHLYRTRRQLDSAQGVEIKVDGRSCLGFCNNDYLGLANHPKVVERFVQAARKYGVGSGASHLVIGHSALHHQLEEALADFVGRPRALLFSSGYMANVGTINSLMGRQDLILQDKLNHASLLDAGQLADACFHRYRHGDVRHLEQRLEGAKKDSRVLIVTDSVFSMDGDTAPMPEIARIAKNHAAWLMVDDAHGFGVLGKTGAGSVEHFGLSVTDVPILMGTLGKAIGTAGAFVAGDESLIEYLIQEARTYIYSTALPPAVAAATLASLELVREEAWRRDHLNKLIKQFRQGARALNLELMNSETAIQPVLVGSASLALEASEKLLEKGVLVTAIRPPTVPQGTARLRITLSAAHTADQVERLLDILSNINLSGN